MRISNNDGVPLVPGNVPVIGEAERPGMLQVSCLVYPKFKAKLDNWASRIGLPPQELGGIIMRMGLIALSYQIDAERPIDDSTEYIPREKPQS